MLGQFQRFKQPMKRCVVGDCLDTYAHVLPSMQRDAARQLATLLHRK